MRGYREKMDRYRLPEETYRQMVMYARQNTKRARKNVQRAMDSTVRDALSIYLFHHVAENWPLEKLECAGMPCNRDTFRVYRAKFYWNLDQVINGATEEKSPHGKKKAGT